MSKRHFEKARENMSESEFVFSFEFKVEAFDDGYESWSPDLPGVTSWGKTRHLATRNLEQAIIEHLDLLVETSGPVPKSLLSQYRKHVRQNQESIVRSSIARRPLAQHLRPAEKRDSNCIEFDMAM